MTPTDITRAILPAAKLHRDWTGNLALIVLRIPAPFYVVSGDPRVLLFRGAGGAGVPVQSVLYEVEPPPPAMGIVMGFRVVLLAFSICDD